MQLILNNPYRIVGLQVGVIAREQDKQTKRLKQYREAYQKPDNDFSFPSLGAINRNIDKVSEAASKLNLDIDKMSVSLFWFYNVSHNVESAFDAFKDEDLDQVLNI
jgi:hypothetical protein